MPELPEVETITQEIKIFQKQIIRDIIVRQPSLRYPINPNTSNLCNKKKVVSIFRRGKYIIIILSKYHLIIHLGMSGRISITKEQIPLKKHDHFDIVGDDYIIRYNDSRRFGAFIVCDNYLEHPLIQNLGIEPLTSGFDTQYLINKLHHKTTPIKQAIMDNKIVVGIGNIYASESLFLAKINPLTPCNTLTKNDCQRLIFAIKKVLDMAIELGGSTLRDYKKTDGSLGYFQNVHQVYGKTNQLCPNCEETNIKSITIWQRNTFYCPHCQK